VSFSTDEIEAKNDQETQVMEGRIAYSKKITNSSKTSIQGFISSGSRTTKSLWTAGWKKLPRDDRYQDEELCIISQFRDDQFQTLNLNVYPKLLRCTIFILIYAVTQKSGAIWHKLNQTKKFN